MEFGKCKECLELNEDLDGCLSCNPKRFQRDFDKWTSENGIIDKLIQDNQLSVRKYGLLGFHMTNLQILSVLLKEDLLKYIQQYGWMDKLKSGVNFLTIGEEVDH